MSLLDFILDLLRNDEAAADFKADPEGSLHRAGLSELCARDVTDVKALVMDNRSVDVKGGQEVNVNAPAAAAAAPGESELQAAVREITNITNNYTYTEAHNVVNDASVNQNIWAGGDVVQKIDTNVNSASGDGAVAIGDDNYGSVNTGDGNVIGDGNTVGNGIVQGDGNAVGDGNVTGNGNDVAVNGSAAGEDNVVNNGDSNLVGDENVQGAFGDGAQVATNGGEIDDDHSTTGITNDSFNDNSDNSTTGITNDSFNDSSDNSTTDDHHTVGNTNDSFNDSSDNSDNSDNSTDDHSVDQDGLINANIPVGLDLNLDLL